MVHVYQINAAEGRRPSWDAFILHPLLRYLIVGLLTLPIFWYCERFPLRRGQLLRGIPAHLIGFVVYIVAFTWLRYLSVLVFPLYEPASFVTLLENLLRRSIIEHFWTYSAVVLAAHAIQFHRDARQRAVAEADLRTELARQQLQILKLQLHPHFLFNALHGISSLMDTNVEAARTSIARFSSLLRTALDQTDRGEITVREELSFIGSYLDLEKLRLGERLIHRMDVDPAALDAVIPTLVLQPIVENAVRHGVERRNAASTLEVTLEVKDRALRARVVNDAPVDVLENRIGVGLGNTRERLRALYGDAQSLTLRRLDGGRVEVVITIPLRFAPREQLRAS